MEFPQNPYYFHKKIDVRPDDFQADREYLSFQRKSNLPVGESRQGPSGGPGMEPAREPGTELFREPATGLARHSGDWLLYAWHKKALTVNGITGEYGKRGLRSKAPDDSEVTSSCDLGPEPDLRKIG
jgi:hypothetical protein